MDTRTKPGLFDIGSSGDTPFLRAFVTDSRACRRPLAEQVAFLSDLVDIVILREKELGEAAYTRLAGEVADACARNRLKLVVHSRVDVARSLGCSAVHLPLPQLRAQGRPRGFTCVGTNVHAVEEVAEAQALGADVLIACPVFAPSCKPGAVFGGVSFLRAVVTRARVPVFALGGVTDATEPSVIACHAAGACRMADYALR